MIYEIIIELIEKELKRLSGKVLQEEFEENIRSGDRLRLHNHQSPNERRLRELRGEYASFLEKF